MEKVTAGNGAAAERLSSERGKEAAVAIKTTDSVHKTAVVPGPGWTVGGMAKGAGMLAPGLATMLVVLTTDADVTARARLRAAGGRPHHVRPGGLGRLHVHQRHGSAARLGRLRRDARGTSSPRRCTRVCLDLARQLVADAEGALEGDRGGGRRRCVGGRTP